MRRVLIAWMVVAAWLASTASGQGFTVAGQVIAPDGTPIADAEITVGRSTHFPEPGVEPGPITRTDESGRFEIPISEERLRRPGRVGGMLHVVAWKKGFAPEGCFVNPWTWTHSPPDSIRLTLHQFDERPTVRVVHSDGRPVVAARIVPVSLRTRPYESLLTDTLTRHLEARTDDRGRARLPFDPANVTRYRIELDETTHLLFGGYWPEEIGDEIRLPALESRQLEIGDETPADLAPFDLRIHTSLVLKETSNTVMASITCTTAVRDHDQTEVTVLGPHAMLRSTPPSDAKVHPRVVLPDQEVAPIQLRFDRTRPYTFRALDKESGIGIENVEFRMQLQHGAVALRLHSGTDGLVRFHAPPANAWFHEVRTPLTYCPPDPSRIVLPEGTEQPPDFLIDRGVVVEGTTNDPAGRAIRGALVLGVHFLQGADRMRRTHLCVSDEAGRFQYGPVLPGLVEFSSISGAAATVEPVRTSAPAAKPVQLVLDRSFSLTCRVMDEDDRPIPEAHVEIWQLKPGAPYESRLRRLQADSRGQLTTDPILQADREYRLQVVAPGYQPTFSAPFTAGGDPPSTVRARRLATVSGTIVDHVGKPVVGAVLSAPGDTQEREQATTDDHGRFELTKLYHGEVVLIGRHSDHGTFGLVVESPVPDLVWRLPSADASETRGPQVRQSRKSELELARTLLEPALHAAREKDDPVTLFTTVSVLARIDPDEALREIAGGSVTGPLADSVMREVILTRAKEDLEEALSLLSGIEDRGRRSWTLLELAQRLPDDARDEKLFLTAEAVLVARQAATPAFGVFAQADAADALIEQGRTEQALRLLRQIWPMAKDLPSEEWAGYARSRVAESWSLVDAGEAVAVIRDMNDPFSRKRHLANFAQRVAVRDPDLAEAILQEVGTETGGHYLGPRLGHALAPTDTSRALKIVRGLPDPEASYGLGVVAHALADTDPERATEILEEALTRLDANRERHLHRNHLPRIAAALVPVVQKVAPGDLEEWKWRIVSLRPSRPRYWGRSGGHWAAHNAGLALMISRIDPKLGRTLLGIVLEAWENHEPRIDSLRTMPHAIALLAPEIAVQWAKDQPDSVRVKMAKILAYEGADRWNEITKRNLIQWVIGRKHQ